MDIVRFGLASLLVVVVFADSPASAGSPTMTVSPSMNLTDGQSVTVTVRGFPTQGSKWIISECATASGAKSAGYPGCGNQPAAQPFLVTDDHGSGVGSVVVRANATDVVQSPSVDAAGAPRTACLGRCVIAIYTGTRVLTVPITFDRHLPRTGLSLEEPAQAGALASCMGLFLLLFARRRKHEAGERHQQ
jgi:hypothetical protein